MDITTLIVAPLALLAFYAYLRVLWLVCSVPFRIVNKLLDEPKVVNEQPSPIWHATGRFAGRQFRR